MSEFTEREETAEFIREHLTKLLERIVECPQELRVDKEEDRLDIETTVYKISPHKNDIGRIIGKQGKVIQAMREIYRTLANRHHFKVILKVVE